MFAESHDGKQTSGGSQGGMINGQSPAWSDFKRRKEENEKRVLIRNCVQLNSSFFR